MTARMVAMMTAMIATDIKTRGTTPATGTPRTIREQIYSCTCMVTNKEQKRENKSKAIYKNQKRTTAQRCVCWVAGRRGSFDKRNHDLMV